MMLRSLALATALLLAGTAEAKAKDCVSCHQDVTPKIVSDWKLSKHAENDLSCDTCHGAEHTSAKDVAEVSLPTTRYFGDNEKVTGFWNNLLDEVQASPGVRAAGRGPATRARAGS